MIQTHNQHVLKSALTASDFHIFCSTFGRMITLSASQAHEAAGS